MRLSILLLLSPWLCSCSVIDQPLMPTPVIYEVYDVGPLDHIPEGERWNLRTVYYATTRAREWRICPSRETT